MDWNEINEIMVECGLTPRHVGPTENQPGFHANLAWFKKNFPDDPKAAALDLRNWHRYQNDGGPTKSMYSWVSTKAH